MNILIVDDSALMRGIIRLAIEQHGSGASPEIFEATNGEEAIQFLATTPIDLVFVDWNMPVLDGLSLVRRLRADGISIPIIMITAVSDEDKIYEACRAGVTDYIEKPVRGTDLWERIKGFIR